MIRILLWLLGGILLGGIVHLVTVLMLPRMRDAQDAYARLTPIAPVNRVTPIPAPTPENAAMPFMDPAFAMAVCRYDPAPNGSAEILGADQSRLHLGLVLFALRRRLLRDQRPRRRPAPRRSRLDLMTHR